MKFFGVLKQRVKCSKSGIISYKHFRKVHSTSSTKNRKYGNLFKTIPESVKARFLRFL